MAKFGHHNNNIKICCHCCTI